MRDLKIIIFSIFLIATTSGCASTIEKNYAKVDYTNGINRFEAVDIANYELLNTYFSEYFQGIEPQIRKDKHAAKYPEYYFVDYTPDVYMDFTSYLVVINRESGEVIHSRDYYWPDRFPELDFVFN